jgi:hypothetical protein
MPIHTRAASINSGHPACLPACLFADSPTYPWNNWPIKLPMPTQQPAANSCCCSGRGNNKRHISHQECGSAPNPSITIVTTLVAHVNQQTKKHVHQPLRLAPTVCFHNRHASSFSRQMALQVVGAAPLALFTTPSKSLIWPRQSYPSSRELTATPAIHPSNNLHPPSTPAFTGCRRPAHNQHQHIGTDVTITRMPFKNTYYY